MKTFMAVPARGLQRRPHLRIWAPLLAVCLASCSSPRMEGPQIPNPPDGFMYDANATQARNVFPDREIARQHAWGTMSERTNSSIYMTEHAGPSTRDAVQAARDALEVRYPYNTTYGPLQDLTIDGQPAWGWLETQYYKGEISSMEYKAVVTLEGTTHVIEFFSKNPKYMSEAALRELVCSFEIGRRKVSWPLVGVGVVLVALVIFGIRRVTRPF
jgi:hypothetical protein